jgi:predicted phage terminase large subunit-like protein
MNCHQPIIPPELLDSMIKDKKIRTAITKKSHWFFFNLYFANYVKYATADFQQEILSFTEDESIKKLFIVAFRGSGKSTMITTSFPIWSILGVQQKKFVLILTQTKAQAKQHMMNLRMELENNDLLKKDLGPFQEEANEWGSGSLVFSQANARITIASSEQSIRGLRHGPHRPDLIICDDVEDLASTKTNESREKTYEWLTSEVIPCGDNNTRLIVVGNLLHEDSLLMKLKKRVADDKLSGVFKEYPLLDDEDTILWPGKYPTMVDIENERKSIGSNVAWQREYLLKILPTDDQVIHEDWIHYYDKFPSKDSEDFRYTWSGVDLAISQKSTADYTAIVSAQVYGYGDNMKIFILPYPINERLTFPFQAEKIKAVSTALGGGVPTQVFVENVGYQQALPQLLQSSGFPVEGVPVHGEKRERLALMSYLIQNGRILFPNKGCEKLLQQMIGFGTEKHDDLVDAFTLLMGKIISCNPPIDNPEVFFV